MPSLSTLDPERSPAVDSLTRYEEALPLFIVEQNARTALRHADRAYVLEQGRIRFEGTGESILHHPEVQQAYLGQAPKAGR